MFHNLPTTIFKSRFKSKYPILRYLRQRKCNGLYMNCLRSFSSAQDFDPNIDYYGILGLKKFASKDEVKKKYLGLVQKYHPDRNPTADQDKFKRMTAAYSVLSNDKSKDAYDAIKRQTSSTFTGSTPGWQYKDSSAYSQNRNQYGYHHRNAYQSYTNAKSQYERRQSQAQQEAQDRAKKEYQRWYEAQRSQHERDRARQQQAYERYYRTYDDFMSDFERKYGQREKDFKQNFDNNRTQEEYQKYYDPHGFDKYGRPMSKQAVEDALSSVYKRIFIFMVGFLAANFFVAAVRQRTRRRDMEYMMTRGADGYIGPSRQQIILTQVGDPVPIHYTNVPERYRQDRQEYSPVFYRRGE